MSQSTASTRCPITDIDEQLPSDVSVLLPLQNCDRLSQRLLESLIK